MGDQSEIVAGRLAEEKQLIHTSQTAAHETLSASDSPFSFCNVTNRERGGWGLRTRSKYVGNMLLRAFPKPLWLLQTAPIMWYTLYLLCVGRYLHFETLLIKLEVLICCIFIITI
jgi:hypothetical protein